MTEFFCLDRNDLSNGIQRFITALPSSLGPHQVLGDVTAAPAVTDAVWETFRRLDNTNDLEFIRTDTNTRIQYNQLFATRPEFIEWLTDLPQGIIAIPTEINCDLDVALDGQTSPGNGQQYVALRDNMDAGHDHTVRRTIPTQRVVVDGTKRGNYRLADRWIYKDGAGAPVLKATVGHNMTHINDSGMQCQKPFLVAVERTQGGDRRGFALPAGTQFLLVCPVLMECHLDPSHTNAAEIVLMMCPEQHAKLPAEEQMWYIHFPWLWSPLSRRQCDMQIEKRFMQEWEKDDSDPSERLIMYMTSHLKPDPEIMLNTVQSAHGMTSIYTKGMYQPALGTKLLGQGQYSEKTIGKRIIFGAQSGTYVSPSAISPFSSNDVQLELTALLDKLSGQKSQACRIFIQNCGIAFTPRITAQELDTKVSFFAKTAATAQARDLAHALQQYYSSSSTHRAFSFAFQETVVTQISSNDSNKCKIGQTLNSTPQNVAKMMLSALEFELVVAPSPYVIDNCCRDTQLHATTIHEMFFVQPGSKAYFHPSHLVYAPSFVQLSNTQPYTIVTIRHVMKATLNAFYRWALDKGDFEEKFGLMFESFVIAPDVRFQLPMFAHILRIIDQNPSNKITRDSDEYKQLHEMAYGVPE